MNHPPLWSTYTLILLALWLLASPATFDYHSHPLSWSDYGAGLLLLALSLSSRRNPRQSTLWWIAGIGIWLQLAPLIFWAPNGAGYLNNTLVGSFIITLSVICFPLPGQLPDEEPSVPPGWSYNPSSWAQRIPIALFAFICWMISRYLSAYQLGYIDVIWDPFFHPGTRAVLESDVSKAFPVSDAGLGAFAYTLEFFSTLQGGKTRWRTSPWLVLVFGILVIPVSLVSTILIILQPLAVGTWCTLCLATAVFMLIGIPFAIDEVVATLQFLKQNGKNQKFLPLLFRGGISGEASADRRSPSLQQPFIVLCKASLWGMTFPKGLVGASLLGIAMMALPTLFNIQSLVAKLDPILGAFIIVVSVIAFSEMARSLRWINCGFAVLLLAATGYSFSTIHYLLSLAHLVIAFLIALCSIPKGKIKERF